MKPIRNAMLAGLLGLTAAACSHEVKPDRMTAEQHRTVAAKEEQQAKREVVNATADSPGRDSVNAGLEPELLINPDASSSNLVNERLAHARYLQEHAREHEQAAAQLEGFEDAQCKQVPSSKRATCPLLGPIADVRDIDGGVRIRLAAGKAQDLLPVMRCHEAYARAHGGNQSPACALYVPGAEFRDTDDPHAIDIVGKDRKTTDEIRKRVHAGAQGQASRNPG